MLVLLLLVYNPESTYHRRDVIFDHYRARFGSLCRRIVDFEGVRLFRHNPCCTIGHFVGILFIQRGRKMGIETRGVDGQYI